MTMKKLTKSFTITVLMLSLFACSKDDDSITNETDTTWTISIGAFTLDNGTYTATGNELIFDSKEECQIWNRTAEGDNHNSNTHLHYNAAANVSYDNNSKTFLWTEFGPEIDQASIENTCSNGANGVNKTVNDNSYYQDKPNLYLKIINVTEN